MLGQRLEGIEKSQTLPPLDGQDEGDTLESQCDLLSIANSCPDLTVIENPDVEVRNGRLHSQDVVDGLYIKHAAPVKLPLSFRRSTSLNSLAADDLHNAPNAVDGNASSANHSGSVAKVVGKFEGLIKKDSNSHDGPNDFTSATHNGSNHLQKSISTPSVTQIFGSAAQLGIQELRARNLHTQRPPSINVSALAPPSSKRSFFRRKHKAKAGAIHAHPPVIVQHFRNTKMMDNLYPVTHKEDDHKENYGKTALSDPALGLQEPDIDCWAMFMGRDVANLLKEKEIKRQEHMYELILTEKHHCLTLALMHNLFVGGMKRAGYSREARLLFPGLSELLKVHFTFLSKMRERQLDFRDRGQPIDSLADLINEQFSGEQWQAMVRLYGLLCSSHKTSLDLFKILQKESKFAALVSLWGKEPLLARKNVPECLLLVAQRITKYPLLLEPLFKTAPSDQERNDISKALKGSRELNEKVNERVAERESLIEFFQKLDSKSAVQAGSRWLRRDDIMSVPSRRLLFRGQACVINRALMGNSYSHSGSINPPSSRNIVCTVLILTDYLVFVQEISGRYHFVTPPLLPGVVMLNHLIVRENAGQNSSLFLVLGTGTSKPEMIELQVMNPPHRDKWIETIREAITKSQEEVDIMSDGDEDGVPSTEMADFTDVKTARALEEIQDYDRQITALLKLRTKLVENLRVEKPSAWSENNIECRDDVLNAIAKASSEVQKVIHQIDQTTLGVVNRSASCVSEHVTSGLIAGLPRRADTFSGFDSQQRSSMDLAQLGSQKLLYQVVVQLAEVCGEMFQQMMPQLTPHMHQSQHQLQRRMEDLREAQQRLETEKADWQREFVAQQEELEKKQNEMKSKETALKEQEKDIIQQREQLYRKLEALQKQGIRPNLDSVSPAPLSTNAEKAPNFANLPPRRPPNPNPVGSIVPQATNNSIKLTKQQIPHFLANSSAVKASGALSPGAEPPRPAPRTYSTAQLKSQPSQENTSPIEVINSIRASQGKGHRTSSASSKDQIQQVLPYRLSEGPSFKTSSLPRGVGSRSTSSVDRPPQQMNFGPNMRSSSSSNHVLQHSQSVSGHMFGEMPHPPTTTYMYSNGSGNDRMSSYYRNSNEDPRLKSSNGYAEYPFANTYNSNAVPVVHRRSGSSPVPMSAVQTNATSSRHHEDDFDSTKVLFL